MSISGRAVQVSNMRLHGYDLEGFSQGCESFQQLHRKGRGKLGLDEPGFDPFDDVRREYFFTSPAWDALRLWVIRHPRLAKARAACDPYLPGWYDRAIVEARALAR